MDGVVEIITGRERRRRWSTTDKLRLVAETEEAGTSVRAVAARHGICESLLFTWRRQVREGALVGALDIPMFVPVQMISGATTSPSPSAGHPVRPASVSRAAAATVRRSLGWQLLLMRLWRWRNSATLLHLRAGHLGCGARRRRPSGAPQRATHGEDR